MRMSLLHLCCWVNYPAQRRLPDASADIRRPNRASSYQQLLARTDRAFYYRENAFETAGTAPRRTCSGSPTWPSSTAPTADVKQLGRSALSHADDNQNS